MRNKVLLNIYLAATQKTYEFRVPYDVRVGKAATVMARILGRREHPLYIPQKDACLMYINGRMAGDLLDENSRVRELVVKEELLDGQLLALV